MDSNKIDATIEPVLDVIVSILYLSGIAIIERWIRPWFGSTGIPAIANSVLLIGDAILIVSLVRRFVLALDELWQTLSTAKWFQSTRDEIIRLWNKRKSEPPSTQDEGQSHQDDGQSHQDEGQSHE